MKNFMTFNEYINYINKYLHEQLTYHVNKLNELNNLKLDNNTNDNTNDNINYNISIIIYYLNIILNTINYFSNEKSYYQFYFYYLNINSIDNIVSKYNFVNNNIDILNNINNIINDNNNNNINNFDKNIESNIYKCDICNELKQVNFILKKYYKNIVNTISIDKGYCVCNNCIKNFNIKDIKICDNFFF